MVRPTKVLGMHPASNPMSVNLGTDPQTDATAYENKGGWATKILNQSCDGNPCDGNRV